MGFLPRLTRALIPSWRFFSDIEDLPVLRARFIDLKGEGRPWHLHPSFREVPPRPRQVFELFHNPEGNRRLADRALVQRALIKLVMVGESDFQSSDDFNHLKVLALEALPVETPRFQFQIWVKTKEGEEVEAFLSQVFDFPKQVSR